MKPTIYIAGPMRGRPNDNRDAFAAAARRLAAKGWQPVNPVDVARILPCVEDDGTRDGMALARLMEVERHIAAKCDALYLLNGWARSAGALGEVTAFLQSRQVYASDGVVLELDDGVFLESDGVPDALPRPDERGGGAGR